MNDQLLMTLVAAFIVVLLCLVPSGCGQEEEYDDEFIKRDPQNGQFNRDAINAFKKLITRGRAYKRYDEEMEKRQAGLQIPVYGLRDILRQVERQIERNTYNQQAARNRQIMNTNGRR